MTKPCLFSYLTLLGAAFFTLTAQAAEPQQSDYYTITGFTAPDGEVIEGGGIALLPDGKVAVCTRRALSLSAPIPP